MKKKKTKMEFVRYLLLAVTIIVIMAAVVYFVSIVAPDLIPLLEHGNEQEIENYLRNAGNLGYIFLALLQFLQIVTVVFPGSPIHIVAGLLYGVIIGTLLCLISHIAANLFVFLLSRKLGSLIDGMFPAKSNGRFETMLLHTKDPAYTVFLACLIPMVPNGMIPHIAAKTEITLKEFTLAVACGSFPSIFIFVFCGRLLLQGHFILAGVLAVLELIGVLLLFHFRNRIMEHLPNRKQHGAA
ncbi:TVP38/TMEM64 family protein [Anaerolentibacter hominis]|uniref:TVP38/TMEM64 family protein n=1 Tax=Anaerolentibacter hominis TaxID=3079009 RepID=UPI0031B87596